MFRVSARDAGPDESRRKGAVMIEPTAAEVASGVEYADVSLYAETCPCGATVPMSDHSHDSHWEQS